MWPGLGPRWWPVKSPHPSRVVRSFGPRALGLQAGLPDPVEVVPDLGPGAILAGQRRHQVNVIGGMTDRHPPHPQVIALESEPRAVHDLGRDLRPLRIGQDTVLGGGAYRAVPHRLAVAGTGEGRQRLGQQPGQAAQIRRPAGAAFRLQFRRISEPGDPALDCVPRAAASVTSAANAPRASPDRAAAALTSSNSSSVSENCTTFGRDTPCRDRRRLTVLATTTTRSTAEPSSGGNKSGPTSAAHCGAGLIV